MLTTSPIVVIWLDKLLENELPDINNNPLSNKGISFTENFEE